MDHGIEIKKDFTFVAPCRHELIQILSIEECLSNDLYLSKNVAVVV